MAVDSLSKEVSGKVAIATTTLYKPDSESDRIRSQLAERTARIAGEIGYEFVVVDSGSPDDFLSELQRYGAKLYPRKPTTMGEGRRDAIRTAYDTGKPVIAWLEPEKCNYVLELANTVVPILEGKADLVVPRRRSLDSYHEFQQLTEKVGNLYWRDLTGIDLDVWFGPRTWEKNLSEYFLRYAGEYGDEWHTIFIPLLDIIADNHKVIGVDIEYAHPKEQAEIEKHSIEFHAKRIRGLSVLTEALKSHFGKLNEPAH